MLDYDLSHITELENVGTREALQRRVDDLIQSSSSVQAVVEWTLTETGEYAIAIRGVVATQESASATEDGRLDDDGFDDEVRFDDFDAIDIADPPGGEG